MPTQPRFRSIKDLARRDAAPTLRHGKEYAFDCLLAIAIRVPDAKDEAHARQMLAENLDCADSNFGAWFHGDPITAEASLAADVMTPRLYEVAGEPVDFVPDTGTLPEALAALRALLAAADRVSETDDGEDGYTEDDIDTLIGKARQIVAKHDARGATIIDGIIQEVIAENPTKT